MGKTALTKASVRVRMPGKAALVGAWVSLWGAGGLAAPSTIHPMDPLSGPEYAAVTELLRENNYADEESFYPLITLLEPAKDEVLRFKPGDAVSRRAFVVVKKELQTFEAVVDLGAGKVASWEEIPDVQPGVLLSDEWTLAQQIVLSDPGWRAALRERGMRNPRDVVCIPLTAGYFGIAEEEGRRLVKVVCYDTRGTRNFWGRPPALG